ncbi:MAG: DUF4235 domain-containing protein [Solirubrobacteraceae bacterium]
MQLLYKPFSLIFTMTAAWMGRGIFRSLWERIDSEEPPRPTSYESSLGKVVGAAALEAATMATTGAAAHRAAARTFHYLTGIWPGDKKAKESRRRARARDRS